jgi:prepilin-type N-terminal cleavage/methylation domain-containing protein
MRHSNVSNYNQGFTLLEGLLVLVIVGILAAMMGPSYLAWNQRQQINAALNTVEGAIKEAQRQAMAESKDCTLTINDTSVTANDKCLITGRRELNNLADFASDITIGFNHQGETTAAVTIVLTHNDNDNLQRCLVVSTPLGLIGKGENPSSGVCNP